MDTLSEQMAKILGESYNGTLTAEAKERLQTLSVWSEWFSEKEIGQLTFIKYCVDTSYIDEFLSEGAVARAERLNVSLVEQDEASRGGWEA